jgi:hypothetical protein
MMQRGMMQCQSCGKPCSGCPLTDRLDRGRTAQGRRNPFVEGDADELAEWLSGSVIGAEKITKIATHFFIPFLSSKLLLEEKSSGIEKIVEEKNRMPSPNLIDFAPKSKL